MTLQQVEKQYKLLYDLFGVEHHIWDQLHIPYNPYSFCAANRKSFIAEYLAWEQFVENAKKVGFDSYYPGIDEFLDQYKRYVEACLYLR